jgi:hypothetical protein
MCHPLCTLAVGLLRNSAIKATKLPPAVHYSTTSDQCLRLPRCTSAFASPPPPPPPISRQTVVSCSRAADCAAHQDHQWHSQAAGQQELVQPHPAAGSTGRGNNGRAQPIGEAAHVPRNTSAKTAKRRRRRGRLQGTDTRGMARGCVGGGGGGLIPRVPHLDVHLAAAWMS